MDEITSGVDPDREPQSKDTYLAPAEDTPLAPAEDTSLAPAEDMSLAPAEDMSLAPAEDMSLAPAEDTSLTPAKDTSLSLQRTCPLPCLGSIPYPQRIHPSPSEDPSLALRGSIPCPQRIHPLPRERHDRPKTLLLGFAGGNVHNLNPDLIQRVILRKAAELKIPGTLQPSSVIPTPKGAILRLLVDDLAAGRLQELEPHLTNGLAKNVNRPGSKVYSSPSNARACIRTSLKVQSCPAPKFTDRDMATICMEIKGSMVMVASVYVFRYSFGRAYEFSLEELLKHCNNKRIPLIIGMDSNAHNQLWGSAETKRRGEKLEELG
eukprot:maker-scaffold411_size179879-snap-gene-0.31 protein:Tk06328 transcript:maker-scaffold411_size179879-snap-gene-0.31-mRNA-1 annotation:"hypothetical protein YYC_04075"